MTLLKRIGFRIENKLLAPSQRLKPSLRDDGAPRALIIASYDPRGIPTVAEYLNAFVTYSKLRFDILNINYCPIRRKLFELPASFDFSPYQAVVISPSASFNPEQLFVLDRRMRRSLKDYGGVKVILKQDEHYRTGRFLEYLDTVPIDVLGTTYDPDVASRIYPASRYPGLCVLPMLTGYITEEMVRMRYPATEDRPIDVGYRGSPQQWSFGTLAYEKREIGDRFAALAPRLGLRTDISSRWEDRFTGKSWFDFLGRCKATLGVESGASIVDFTGEVERACKEYLGRNAGASFDDLFKAVLAPYHENVRYRTVSPRHFEAAATRTLQILYEGDYRGIFKPWEHYVPLRRDFANVEEAVAILRQPAKVRAIVDRAYEEIAANPEYQYSAFVARLDAAILERIR